MGHLPTSPGNGKILDRIHHRNVETEPFSGSRKIQNKCCFAFCEKFCHVTFAGGVPDPEVMTSSRYDQTFSGCISDVHIQREGPLNLGLESIGGLNVEPCDSFK